MIKDNKYILDILKIIQKELAIDLISSEDPFYVLISCVLSLRTQDNTTSNAAKRLFSLAKNPYEMERLSISEIQKAIYPVGFYRIKARNIKQICKDLIIKFKGKVPQSREALLSLKGVGRKTANLVLSRGFNKPAICVDTHVHRISNRLGLVKTDTPLQTEEALAKILPKRYWKIINPLFVKWGQLICRPRLPLCERCKIRRFCNKKG